MSFLSLSPDPVASVEIADRLIYVSRTKYEQDWLSLPHLHRFTELMLITEGEGSFVSGENFYPVRKGNLIIISGGHMHTEVSNPANALSYLAIGLRNTVFTAPSQRFIFDSGTDFSVMRNCLEGMFSELQSKKQNHDLIISSLMSAFCAAAERASRTEATSTQEDDKGKLTPVLAYIDSNYNDDISLDSLCGIAYISRPHLIRLFKETTGHTPMDYLRKRRLDAAKTLLITTDLPVGQIAMLINFPSVSTFITEFRNYTASTPLQFRKNR